MSGFDDLFEDVQFPDLQVNTDGSATVEGQTVPAEGETGQGDTGAQATQQTQDDKSGQTSDSHTDMKDEGDKKTAEPPAADDTGEGAKKEEETKPLPYDQDPKWKKARAAEKQFDELLDKFGYLNVEELVHDLETGKGLAQKLAGRDVDALLDAASKYGDAKSRYEAEARAKAHEGETPEDAVARLEAENETLRSDLQRERDTIQSQEKAQQIIENFEDEVGHVLDVMEEPFSEDEMTMALLLMGVQNPANMIDIEDRTQVRKMAKGAAAAFQRFLGKVKQDAIDKYAAGKSDLTTTSQRATAETGSKAVQKKQSLAADPNASVDDVFAEAQTEFAEVLSAGIKAAQ